MRCLPLLVAAGLMASATSAQNTENMVWIADADSGISSDLDNSRHVAWVDVDADEDLDLVVINFAAPRQVFLNPGTGQLVKAVMPGNALLGTSDALGAAFGDVDGDGDQDALIANGSDKANLLLENLSAAPDGLPGMFVVRAGSGVEGELKQSYDAAFGDLDGDGVLDLVVANRYATNDVYFGVGDGSFVRDDDSVLSQLVQASRDVELVDVDGDGDLDVLEANSTSFHNLYYVNLGGEQGGVEGTFGGRSFDYPGGVQGRSNGLAVADLDGDGLLDVASANRDEPNAVHRNTYDGDGAPTFARVEGTVLDDDAEDSYDVALGDLEGDGDVDLVFGNRFQGNAVYLATSVDPFSSPATGYVRAQEGAVVDDRGNARAVALADVHAYADPITGAPIAGALELAVANANGEANRMYRGYGAQWVSLGDGLGGDLGVPVLSGSGHTAAAETISLRLSNAPGLEATALVTSVLSTVLPFKGGTLLVDPSPGVGLIVGAGMTDAQGSQVLDVDLPAALPPGVDLGLAIYAQMLVSDDTAPVKVGISNALRLRISP